MSPLATVAFTSVNLPITILLILVLIYWVTVIIGILDIDAFDINFDSDADLDVETDVDVEAGADAVATSAGMSVLKFFYVGEMPLMVLLSLFSFSSWVIAMLSNHYLNPGLGIAMGSLLLIPNLFVSCMVVKVVGKPFAKLFKMLNKDLTAKREMVGMPCVVTTSKVNSTFGRAQIETDTSPIIFNAITKDDETLIKGDSAVVLEFIEEKNTYIITSFD